MRKSIFTALTVFCVAGSGYAHTALIKGRNDAPQQQVEIKTEKVAGNIYVLYGSGGNIGVSVGADGILTIDTQFANLADKIKAALKALGNDTPKFVFNTHWHGDHTGGNEIFGRDSIIIANENVRKRMAEVTVLRGQPRTPSPLVALPMISYNSELSMFFNGENIRAVHFPKGHTDGDTVIFFTASNVVHLGDDFFVERFPFVDLESGGSVEGLIKNIGALIQMIPSDAKLIPGHGKVSSIDELRDYHQMLMETTLVVRKQMKEGKTLDQIKAAGFAEKYKDAGSGFINTAAWIETIFKSYSFEMAK